MIKEELKELLEEYLEVRTRIDDEGDIVVSILFGDEIISEDWVRVP